jgi:hypothetical protein
MAAARPLVTEWQEYPRRMPPCPVSDRDGSVALANKMARIAWKLMLTGETYIPKFAPAAVAAAA